MNRKAYVATVFHKGDERPTETGPYVVITRYICPMPRRRVRTTAIWEHRLAWYYVDEDSNDESGWCSYENGSELLQEGETIEYWAALPFWADLDKFEKKSKNLAGLFAVDGVKELLE